MQEAMNQVTQEARDYKPTITAARQRLHDDDKFSYLGSTLSRAVHIDEVTARIT